METYKIDEIVTISRISNEPFTLSQYNRIIDYKPIKITGTIIKIRPVIKNNLEIDRKISIKESIDNNERIIWFFVSKIKKC